MLVNGTKVTLLFQSDAVLAATLIRSDQAANLALATMDWWWSAEKELDGARGTHRRRRRCGGSPACCAFCCCCSVNRPWLVQLELSGSRQCTVKTAPARALRWQLKRGPSAATSRTSKQYALSNGRHDGKRTRDAPPPLSSPESTAKWVNTTSRNQSRAEVLHGGRQ